jgi:hypothetical protein
MQTPREKQYIFWSDFLVRHLYEGRMPNYGFIHNKERCLENGFAYSL